MAGEKKVVDASVVIKWFVNEQGSNAATELRNNHIKGDAFLIVPDLLFIEVLNALRYKGATSKELSEVNEALWEMQFHVEKMNPFLLEKSIQVALQYKLTLYDALYVAIAQTFGLPLVTEDAALLKVPNSIQLTKAK